MGDSSRNTNPDSTSDQPRSSSNSEEDGPRGMEAVKAYALEHKIDMILWVTRALTILFCLSYIFPVFSNPYSSFQKAMMSSAASSALRLHQRIPSIQFTREFLAQLTMEDSAHYLFYSIIFMYSSPITMVLIPIFLFAMLHFASFSCGVLDIMGQGDGSAARLLHSLVEYQQRNMLRGAAFCEILLMPLAVISLFMGRVSLLTPILYYRFLSLRYSSRRNMYTRTIFYELRMNVEYLANRPATPAVLTNVITKAVAFISNLAPPFQAQ